MGLTISRRFDALGGWAVTHWVSGTELHAVSVRQKVENDQWYVVQGYGERAAVLSGPHASVEAAVMLLAMGVIGLEERRGEMESKQGNPSDSDKWEELYWLYEAGVRDSLAIRKLRVDGQWYVTHGYIENTHLLHGPYPSREAVEMLLEMGLLEL